MKSVLDLSRIAVLATLVLATGCGQKGPLYLPEAKAPMARPVPQTPPAPPDTASPVNQ